MTDKVNLEAFPITRIDALALEYTKLVFSEGTTPEAFAETYRIAHDKIKQYFSEVRQGVRP